jgi:Niemann-Pick C1 N terminus
MQKSLRMAEPFIIGCPACLQNFRNLFCTIICSPNQATFTNVTVVQRVPPAPDAQSDSEAIASRRGIGEQSKHGGKRKPEEVTAVEEVSFFLSEEFKNATFNSCKDVAFGAANTRAMLFIGNGATTAPVRNGHALARGLCSRWPGATFFVPRYACSACSLSCASCCNTERRNQTQGDVRRLSWTSLAPSRTSRRRTSARPYSSTFPALAAMRRCRTASRLGPRLCPRAGTTRCAARAATAPKAPRARCLVATPAATQAARAGCHCWARWACAASTWPCGYRACWQHSC